MKIEKLDKVEIDGKVQKGHLLTHVRNYPADRLTEFIEALDAFVLAQNGPVEEDGTAADQVLVLSAEKAQLMAQVSQLQQALQLVSPDLTAVIADLKSVGFYEWMTIAALEDSDLLDEIAAIKVAATSKPANIGIIQRNFAKLMAASPADEVQLARWQAVLDQHKIHPALLSFAGGE